MEKERLKFLLEYSEMQSSEVEFIINLLKNQKPKKILEVGIAAGSCSAFMLDEMKNSNVEMFGIDYNESYYRDNKKKSGWILDEANSDQVGKVKVFTGGVAARFMDTIGGNIDFCVIDTMHILPGELLDFLMVLPYLKDGAICVLHDSNLQNLLIENGAIKINDNINVIESRYESDAYATGLLMDVLACEKIFPDNYIEKYVLPNIVAFKVTADVRKYINNVFLALALPWKYKLSEKDINDIGLHFKKHYSEVDSSYFYKIAKLMNEKFDFESGSLIGKKDNADLFKRISKQESIIASNDIKINQQGQEISELTKRLTSLESSKFWKIRNMYLKLKLLLLSPHTFIRRYYKRIFLKNTLVSHFIKEINVLVNLMLSLPEFFSIFFLKGDPHKKNIVFQLESFDKGGLEEVVFGLVENIKKSDKYNVYVFVNSNNLGYLGNKLRSKTNGIVLINKNTFLLKAILKKIKIDLVHLHYSTFGIDLYKENGVSVLYTIHNNYIWADDEFVKRRKGDYEKVDKFVAVSDQVMNFFCRRFKVDRVKVSTIPNGLDLSLLKNPSNELRSQYGLNEKDFVFINVASFNWNKFHILMVTAMERIIHKYPNFKMLFVGNPLDENTFSFIKQKIKEKGLEDSIKIIDYVPKNKVLGLLKMSDCYLMPSIIEGWSIAVMEAMYSDLPLILSKVGSAENVIKNNDIGIIINNPYCDINELNPSLFDVLYRNDENLNNLDELCDAMEDMHKNFSEWKEKAKLGRIKIEKYFNTNEMTKSYLSEFEKLLNKKI